MLFFNLDLQVLSKRIDERGYLSFNVIFRERTNSKKIQKNAIQRSKSLKE